LTYRKPIPRTNRTYNAPKPDTSSVRPAAIGADTSGEDSTAGVQILDTLSADTIADTTTAAGVLAAPDSVGNPLDKAIAGPEAKPETPVKSLLRPARGFQITFLLFALLLLIFIVNVEQGYVRDMWRVIANENYSSLQQRNQRSTMRQILTFLGYVVFILQAGLFLFHAMEVLGWRSPVIHSLWMSTLLVACVYAARHLALRYLRWLFNRERQLTLYAFDITVFNTMVGLVLLPLNVLLLFGPDSLHKPLIWVGLVTFGCAYLLRQVRWLVASRGWLAQSLLLFFVYLCAVEILPLWALSAIFW
jgi:hypothetical protein